MAKKQAKPHIYVIVGPTGVGKTSLSLALAKKVRGEVISADSRQVYKHLDIGTEKISKKQQQGVPHHLLSVCSPKKVYTVADFQRDGGAAIATILSKHHTPIVVGGTGWYVDALVAGSVLPDVPPNKPLRRSLKGSSAEQLYAQLKTLDAERAKNIDPHNSRRLLRAIEIATALGKVPAIRTQSPYTCTYLGIVPPPQYEAALLKRLQQQLRKGLLSEIRDLLGMRISKTRIRELGLEYRTGLRYIDGEISRKDMENVMLTELKQLAKRQRVWFKRNPRISWKTYAEHLQDIAAMS